MCSLSFFVLLELFMTDAELIRALLIEGAIGGAVLSLISFLLSKFVKDIVGRTLLATALFAAAGAYFGSRWWRGRRRSGDCSSCFRLWLSERWDYSVGKARRSGSHLAGYCTRSGISESTILDQDEVSLR